MDIRTAGTTQVTALVRAAQRGDREARDELVATHLPLIYNIVGRTLGRHPDVDDLVQDTMLQALRGLGDLREPDRFRSWLVAIAYRRVQMLLRSRKMTLLRRHPDPVDVPDPVADFAEHTVADIVIADQRRELTEAAAWLDETNRELLALWWQEATGELTRTELAAVLDVGANHAAVRVQRMKTQLDAARAVVRALRTRPSCPDLTGLTSGWDGTPDSVWRKRLHRHVRDCRRCGTTRSGLVTPERLLLGITALSVPAGLLASLTTALPGAALPAGVKVSAVSGLLWHKTLLGGAAAAVVAVGGGFVYAVNHSPEPQTPPAALAPAETRPAPSRAAPARTSPAPGPSAPRPPAGNGVTRADLYVSPSGSDSGDGSADQPYATIGKAVSVVRAGQTIALRGGTHRLTGPITISTNGTAARPVVLSAYRAERPVVDASAVPADKWAITQRAAYWTVQGLEITRAPSQAYVCLSCRGSVFRLLSVHGNGSAGLMLRNPGTVGNQVLDSDFYDNRGSGLAVQFGDGPDNLLRGNRAFRNSGDGVNLGDFGDPVTVEDNWSFDNGANGIALGGGTPPARAAHRARHNASWDNNGQGFTDEGNTAALELTNNTAYGNDEIGFALTTAPALLRGNAAADNTRGDTALATNAKATRNSWQRPDWAATGFRSTDPSGTRGPRQPDGGLPATGFLATRDGSGASLSGD